MRSTSVLVGFTASFILLASTSRVAAEERQREVFGRVALGAAYFHDHVSSDNVRYESGTPQKLDADVNGSGALIDLSLGYSLSNAFALGAFVTGSFNHAGEGTAFNVLGGFGEWHPLPSWLLQAGAGVAVLQVLPGDSQLAMANGYNAYGGAVLFGGGKEWRLGPDTSLSLLARVPVALTSSNGDVQYDHQRATWRHTVITPQLLLGLTLD